MWNGIWKQATRKSKTTSFAASILVLSVRVKTHNRHRTSFFRPDKARLFCSVQPIDVINVILELQIIGNNDENFI